MKRNWPHLRERTVNADLRTCDVTVVNMGGSDPRWTGLNNIFRCYTTSEVEMHGEVIITNGVTTPVSHTLFDCALLVTLERVEAYLATFC